MKFVSSIFFLLLHITSSSQAQDMKYELVPVSQVQIIREMGTGSTAKAAVSFVVPYGGSCHLYKAEVIQAAEGLLLNILDYTFPRCTRVEIIDYKTSVAIELGATEQIIKLANPIYIQEFVRP